MLLNSGQSRPPLRLVSQAESVATIHSPEAFADSVIFDWEFLREAGCWGNTKITPMDIDAVVERRGHFLVFETKRPHVAVPEGQRITLEKLLASLSPKSRVCLLYGRSAATISGFEFWAREGTGIRRKRFHPATADDLIEKVKVWWQWVNKPA